MLVILAALVWMQAGAVHGQTGAAPVAAYGFNEGTGTTTADLSGNGNNGTLSNATWSSAGRVGNALSFNGSNARVSVPDSVSLDLASGMTLAAWVNPSALGSARAAVYKVRGGGFAYALFGSNANSRPSVSLRVSGTNVSLAGPAALPLNTWSHVAATYDGATLRLFVNGQQVNSRTLSGSIVVTNGALNIGSASNSQYFQGLIDEVRVFNQARTQTQIQADMNAAVDATAPGISARSPAADATAVSPTSTVTATFNEAMDASTITGSTFQLTNAAGTAVSATVTYAATTRTATLTPGTALATSTTYNATIIGGGQGVKDVSGNPMPSNVGWSFTTGAGTAATSTTVTSSANPSTSGQAVSFIARVQPVPPATGTPGGTVQFRIDGNDFGTPVSLSNGTATSSSISALTTGDHNVVAVYSGNASFGASTSPTLVQTVGAVSSCAGNAIVVENCLPGSPSSEWDLSAGQLGGDSTIQGFATDISVDRGDTVRFKIDFGGAYRIDIYRLGYYGGLGARKVATVTPTQPQNQPNCNADSSTGLIDCGNWSVSASWAIPANATSGIYIARPTRSDTGGASHIAFVVRDDASTSDLLFQTSDTTWQAYNTYGGNSLYQGGPGTNPARAYKVSYNRPFNTRTVDNGQDWLFSTEYPMVRWLERNGYDVTYFTGVDADRNGALIRQHKAYLSVGHDEYWSAAQRANVEAARNAGVHLAFFSGNEIFWKTRWESSSLDAAAYRTLVSYKETHANSNIDVNDTTGTWADPRSGIGPGQPQNALSGTLFMVNDGATTSIQVPAEDGKMRFWRNTSVATLAPGTTATLYSSTVGYEWDVDSDNGFRPPGLLRMSSRTVTNAPVLQDYGSTFGSGTATHSLTLYRHASGALVFGAGTVQWSWGLDVTHDRSPGGQADVRMQQATVNLFADMGVQPGTLQSGLVAASASTDTSAPSSTITSPAAGATLPTGTPATLSGSAIDTGGGVVGGVEVSVDNGVTWHPANGRSSWTYSWTPTSGGSVTIKSRAVDDSGNLESPTSGVTVTVGSGSQTCPCTIWSNATTPTIVADPDSNAVELGVKFRSNTAGSITAIRFYKSSTNTGPFVVNLWSRTGTNLASIPVTSTTASGWQQVALPTPVPINANTTYVASYHTASGRYSADSAYFTSSVTAGPLTALANGLDGGNGVYAYGSGGFPTQTYNATNYWVDVVFSTSTAADTTPPIVTSGTPASDATQVDTRAAVTVTFSEAMDAATINSNTIVLLDAGSNPVPAQVTYSSSSFTATLTPNASLSTNSRYTVLVKGGSADPRVKDTAGNPMASDVSWSFTTAGLPPTQGPGGPVLVITAPTNPFSTFYAEILRTEGFNLFQTASIGDVSAMTLAQYDVVILGQMPLTAAQVTMLTDWTTAGGNLIAMRPDKQLAGLLGLTDAGSTQTKGYLLIDTSQAPGSGLVGQTIQYQGTADRYTLNGATSVATLYSNATTATSAPAVTVRSVGTNGGKAAAFTYDLARSIVYMRQGNPGWSGQERDGVSPIRSDDLFFGAAPRDVQPDWVDLNKVAIPQADEQQRLLANLILSMNQGRRLLPRFWYFPRGLQAVVVMTGDDHGNGGTVGRFDQFKASSPAGCVVDDWECIRGSSYVYPGTPISDTQAAAYNQQGFEIGLHVNTGCADYTEASLNNDWISQLAQWTLQFPSLPSPTTNRTHCIVWSDYATQPQVELKHGIRLDTNYYYWPPAWNNNRPGFFTGSGMPMRHTQPTGEIIDVYHAVSQMTDESGQTYPFTVDALLDRALGPEGYYGAFTINAHTDAVTSTEADAVVASAKARRVPVVSARQMLRWLDGRNNSSFSSVSWNANTLTFAVKVGGGARGLQVMVPVPTGMQVSSVTANGSPVSYGTASIKGMTYIFLMASAATYQVSFTSGVSSSGSTDIPALALLGAAGLSSMAGIVDAK
jgi:hypothetical protein